MPRIPELKPLVPPAKDVAASKDSIYSDEIQSKFLEADTLSLSIEAENAYSLDRSTPLSALKQMMREHYSPNTLLDNSVASAIVLAVDVETPSFFETIEGYVPSEKVEMLRIRVLSDPRNYWLPAPKAEEDPVVSLHPLVRKPSTLKNINVGDIIKVNFYNNKSQFSSITDIGEVMSVVSRVQRPYDRPALVAIPTVLPALVPLTNTNNTSTPTKPMKMSAKGVDMLKGFEGFRAFPYKDSAGFWTVGYGSLIDTRKSGTSSRRILFEKYVKENLGAAAVTKYAKNSRNSNTLYVAAKAQYLRTKTPFITAAQANQMKLVDNKKFEKIVNNTFKDVPLTQQQFDALVIWAYNLGGFGRAPSLVRAVKNSRTNKETIKKAFALYNRSGGRVDKGLVMRRAKEARLFNDGEYNYNKKIAYKYNGRTFTHGTA